MADPLFDAYMARNTLDVTALTERGEELKQAIFNAVKDTQEIVMSPLPNVLVLTAAQYEDQDPYGDMTTAYKSKDRIYITPLNAMDVVVKDPENLLSNAEPDDDDMDGVVELLKSEGTF